MLGRLRGLSALRDAPVSRRLADAEDTAARLEEEECHRSNMAGRWLDHRNRGDFQIGDNTIISLMIIMIIMV